MALQRAARAARGAAPARRAGPGAEAMAARLALPARGQRHRVVIDTDAANEIDDQFALAWALRSPQALALEAIYAAPFSFAHRRAAFPQLDADLPPFGPPAVGMARSEAEVRRVLAACGRDDVPCLAGTPGYLPTTAGQATPRSAAVDDLITRALATPAEGPPLYVLALGCPTNVAAALLLEPRIAERIVVVWTSGYPSTARQPNTSFNFEQDLRATRRLLAGDVPLVYLPGYHVGAQLRLAWPEVQTYLRGHGPVAELLADLFEHNPLHALAGVAPGAAGLFAHSWVIWDLICVAWLIEPDWVPTECVPMPRVDATLRWQPRRAQQGRPVPRMREAYAVRRDAVFRDLFLKLGVAPGQPLNTP